MNNEDAKDVLKMLIQEYYSQLRHHEMQRSTVSNLLLVIAAAILAFVTFDKMLTITDLPLTVLLFVIGLFGAAFCMKYYERVSYDYKRMKECRNKLDELLFNNQLIRELIDSSREKHSKQFPKLYHEGKFSWIKVYKLWIMFHLFISLLGLILTILILYGRNVSMPAL